jgi:polysaccharide deacetylase family protein (PEP-CTERM system associated)
VFHVEPSHSFDTIGSIPAVPHVLTVDVEEYFHTAVYARALDGLKAQAPRKDHGHKSLMPESRCRESLLWILDVLRARRHRATFFCLGVFAEEHPELVKQIVQGGHEVGCHGYAHRSVRGLELESFRDDIARAKVAVLNACGREPVGYRAPGFSLGPGDRAKHEVLRDLGFKYDSSVFPTEFAGPEHSRAGRRPWELVSGLWELPVAVACLGPLRVPLGGVFFRVLPYHMTSLALRGMQKDNIPAVLYFHPWEFDGGQPRIPVMGPADWVRQYWGLEGNRRKFIEICNQFRFVSSADLLELLTRTGTTAPHICACTAERTNGDV